MERSASQPLVLASASPRRLELVSLLGIPFEVIPSRAEENDVTGSGKERVRVLARRKGEEVAARLPGRTVLAADTLVCVENEVLGKHKMDSHWIQTLPCQNRHFLFSSGAQAKKSSISSAEFTILKGWAFFSSSSVPYP